MLCLYIALLVVRCWHDMVYDKWLSEVFKLLWYEFGACIYQYLAGQPILWIGYLHWTPSSTLSLNTCCDNLWCKDSAINGKHVNSERFPYHPWYFVWYCFVTGLCCLKIKTCREILPLSSMTVFMSIRYIDSYPSSLVFSMPRWFMCSWFNIFAWGDAGTIFLLPFMVIVLFITIVSPRHIFAPPGWSYNTWLYEE